MWLDCSPPYSYRPTFTPSSQSCVAPGFVERRSRSFAGGTFFRTKDAGVTDVSVQLLEDVETDGLFLHVFKDGVLQEVYGPSAADVINEPSLGGEEGEESGGSGVEQDPVCTPLAAPSLRQMVNNSSALIEMPPLDYGGNPAGSVPIFDADSTDPGIPGDQCLQPTGVVDLVGGDSLPADGAIINTIRTGPERTLIILQLTEMINNNPSDVGILQNPPTNEKVRQWDGIQWIPYIPNSDCSPI